MSLVRKLGKRIIFATNSSTRSRNSVLQSLDKMGFNGVNITEIVTVAYLTAVYLHRKNLTGSVYLMAGDGLKEEMDALNVTNFGVGSDDFPKDEAGNFLRI